MVGLSQRPSAKRKEEEAKLLVFLAMVCHIDEEVLQKGDGFNKRGAGGALVALKKLHPSRCSMHRSESSDALKWLGRLFEATLR